MDVIIASNKLICNKANNGGGQEIFRPSSRFPAGLPAASKILFDNSSRLEFEEAIIRITGTKRPKRSQLREIAHEASLIAGRKRYWSGSHLDNLLHPERFRKYGVNSDLLHALKVMAGMEHEEGATARISNQDIHTDNNEQLDTQIINNEMALRNELSSTDQEHYKKVIIKWKKEGRGTGTGSDYSPPLHIQDVNSRGRSTRIFGYKTGRTHHFLSDLELNYFIITECNRSVIDLREQYPLLSLEETIDIANELNIEHPTNPKTQSPIIMTTDLLITVQRGLRKEEVARSVKYANDLENPRVVEKLEIERQYWTRRHIDWAIVTERDIDKTLLENISALRDYREIHDRIKINRQEMDKLEKALRKSSEIMPLGKAGLICDNKFGLKEGTSIIIAYHLVATGKWQVDMLNPISPYEHIPFTSDK
jgi:hypothetical protein